MAKRAEQTKAEVAARVAKKTARGIASLVVWTVGLVVLGIACYFVFRDEGPVTEDRTPEGIIEAYTEMVRPYVPPAQAKPGASTVESWLEYFDGDTGKWFSENVDKLSFMRHQRDPQAWKQLTRDERRTEAVVYLLTFSPLKGGKVESVRLAEGGQAADVEIRTSGTIYKLSMEKDNRTWRARDLMGRIADANAAISNVELPK